MGQSRSRLASLIAKHPFCAFCSGERPTASVEHMPSRILFDAKQRPKGLEFPSCVECQNSTRKAEQVVAVISRLYPDPVSEQQRADVREAFRAAEYNNPGLLAEMHVDQVGVLQRLASQAFALPTWDFLNLGGPICQRAIKLFGQKLAKALHFELTRYPLPRGAGIYVQHYSNFHAFTGEMPQQLMEVLGAEKSLVMGRQQAWGQFSYQSQQVIDGTITAHMAFFRQALSLLMVVYPDPNDIGENGAAFVDIV